MSPIISTKGNQYDPYVVLSRSILVTKYSDYKLIQYYLYSKYQTFLEKLDIDGIDNYKLILKYKKVRFDIDQINKKI